MVMYHLDNGPPTKHTERMILPGSSQKYSRMYLWVHRSWETDCQKNWILSLLRLHFHAYRPQLLCTKVFFWKLGSSISVYLRLAMHFMHSKSLQTRSKKFTLKSKNGFRDGLSYSTPQKSEETRGNAIIQPRSHPIPKFFNGMGLRLGNRISPCSSHFWDAEYDRPSLNPFCFSEKIL